MARRGCTWKEEEREHVGEDSGRGERRGQEGAPQKHKIWTIQIIWLPHFVQKETEQWVGCGGVGAVVTCQRMHRAPETLCLERGGRGGSRGLCRPGQAMLVTVPHGGMGGEVCGS